LNILPLMTAIESAKERIAMIDKNEIAEAF
jgi:hypothetical protein